MKKIIALVVVVTLCIFAFLKLDKSKKLVQKASPNTFYSGAFVYKLKPLEKLGLAARISKQDVTYSELNSKSQFLQDLMLTKYELLTAAVKHKVNAITKTSKKPNVIFYMNKPEVVSNINFEEMEFQLSFSEERPKNALIKINDTRYGRKELALNQVRYSQVGTDIFEERLRILSDIYTKTLLLKISKTNNTTIQGFINKNILKKPLQISDDEINHFASSKGIDLKDKNPNFKNRLRNIIKEQKTKTAIESYITANHANEVGHIFFNPPSFQVPLFANKAIIESQNGTSSLPTYMVFTNLTCNSCGELADHLDELRKLYKNKIRIGFVNNFSDNDWRNQLAAEASFCLNLQSHDAFWDFFKKIAKTKDNLTEASIMATAKSTGVNYDNFNKCFVTQTYKKDVNKQKKYALDLGIKISPTVILGTKVLTGSISKKKLVNSIKANL
ncbi:MAG: thioredoxin domain-containing protein [Bdellovibrionaceae bacterium]|jgi:protein-disulfide isomerase|nr:thioredoxin domain-containing protein [Pseudobdellovibrionaceae bacterium]